MIYLDNAATTKPCPEAVSAALEAMTDNFGNPSSLHRAGLNAQLAMDKARRTIADSLAKSAGKSSLRQSSTPLWTRPSQTSKARALR